MKYREIELENRENEEDRKIKAALGNSIKNDFERIQEFYDLPLGCRDYKNIFPNCNDYLPEGKINRRAQFRNASLTH